ncbi:MAG: DUF748 domain-containing protein [Myxococcales bacterium]|nr:DUF748 domain-containing protein [Myxococcales bacterium]
MKLLRRAALVLTGLFLVLLVLAKFVAPPLLNSGPIHRQIEVVLTDAMTRDIRFVDMRIDLLPPSIVLKDLWVAPQSADDPPLIQGGEVELYLAVGPLLRGQLVIDSFQIKEARVRFVRTAEGIEQGLLSPRDGASIEREDDQRAGVDLAVRHLELTNVVLEFEDRTFDPPIVWALTDLDGTFDTDGLGDPYRARLHVEMQGGGEINATGSIHRDGRLEARYELSRFPIQLLGAYFKEFDRVAGEVSGTVETRGPRGDPDPIEFDLHWQRADIRIDEIELHGDLTLKGRMTGGLAAPQVVFAVDATQATLAFAQVYKKPPGKPAQIEGRIFQGDDGALKVELDAVRIQNMKGSASVDLGERVHLRLRAEPFEIDEWVLASPMLAKLKPSGIVDIDELELRTNPIEVDGRVGFAPIHLPLSDAGRLTLRGNVIGEGDKIRTDGLVLELANETVPVTGELWDLGGTWSYRIAVDVNQADSNRLITALAHKPDLISGLLDFEANLSGELAGEGDFVDSLDGRVRFEIKNGQLRGVSILEATFLSFPAAGKQLFGIFKLPALTKPLAPALERYYGDHFDYMGATLEIQDGLARTEDFRLTTSSYELTVEGSIRLDDLSLDAKGELRLGQELSSRVGKLFRVSRIPGIGGVTIPLTQIGGSLGNPKPKPEWSFFMKALMGNIPIVPDLIRVLPSRKSS